VRVEGFYTPAETGKLELELANTAAPISIQIDGKNIQPGVPAGVWTFPQYPFDAKAGTPIHFTFEAKDTWPGFRVRRPATGPQHRAAYLPGKGDWYDLWTGERLTGLRDPNPETPTDRIPLYVRAGAIIAMGPELQYANEKPADPIELRIYRGADGDYNLYEDEGDNYNYETGAFSEIQIQWNESAQRLDCAVAARHRASAG
jgi:alpha-D-xyloside xylohydrolase